MRMGQIAFADNKIVGLAISKGFGILLIGPLLDFILPGALRWLGAYSPMFWTGRSYLSESTGTFWIFFIISIVIHFFLIMLLLRRFLNRSD